jgi:hypothetical protein
MDTKIENEYKKLLVYTKNSKPNARLQPELYNNTFYVKADIIHDHKVEIFVMILMTFFLNIKLGTLLMIIFFIFYFLYIGNKNHIYDITKNINEQLINDDKKSELYLNCRSSTMNNPYGNYLIGETKDVNFCNNELDNNKANVFNKYNIYENANDKTIGSSNKSDRSFYTTPNSSVINNLNDFKDFLKSDKLTCKIDGYCLMYDDLRFHVK